MGNHVYKVKRNQENIDLFIGFIYNQIQSISDAKFSNNGETYKRLLYMSILDVLSKVAYPQNHKNQDRFIHFINNITKWENGREYYSLPHLCKLFTYKQDAKFYELGKFVKESFQKWNIGYVGYKLTDDITAAEIKKHCSDISDIEDAKFNIDRKKPIALVLCRHDHLLYAYRNCLVHELRKRDMSLNMDSSNEQPYYLSIYDVDLMNDVWSLSYPLKFIENLCKDSVRNLKEHLESQDKNPYKSFDFGDYWIDQMNM